jgi:hypothetical protein
MIEFYLKLSDGEAISETIHKITWKKEDLTRLLAGRKILKMGIRKFPGDYDREGNVEMAIPSDARGILQCKFAEIREKTVVTTMFIIGYVGEDDCYAVAVADFNSGRSLGDGVDISGLDLSPHVIWKET